MKVRVKKVRRICGSILAGYYEMRLLQDEIRLQNVPISMLRGDSAWTLYVTAFRVDRSISQTRYLEDLDFLNKELNRMISLSEKHKILYFQKMEEYQQVFGKR